MNQNRMDPTLRRPLTRGERFARYLEADRERDRAAAAWEATYTGAPDAGLGPYLAWHAEHAAEIAAAHAAYLAADRIWHDAVRALAEEE